MFSLVRDKKKLSPHRNMDGAAASSVSCFPTSWSQDIWPFFRYGPFMFCSCMKLLLHKRLRR